MFIPTPLSALAALSDIFPGEQLQMVRDAISAGNTAGRLWVSDQVEHPYTALLWDQGNNVFYLGGGDLDTDSAKQLGELFAGEVRPEAISAGAPYFRARGLTPGLDHLVPLLIAGVPLRRTVKRFYAYHADEPPVVALPAVPDCLIVPIDQKFFETEREYRNAVLAEIAWMWPGAGELPFLRFLEHGFGSAAVVSGCIACWCTAEYVSPRRCGIGIETIEV